MRRTISLAFLLAWMMTIALGLFVPTENAAAQSNAPQMTIRAAYSGYFKYGEWLPIWVELANQGPDLEGEVRVEVNTSQGLIVYSVTISLPSGSRKLTPVYVLPNNFSRELLVRLVSQGKMVASASATVRPQANISFIAGLVAPQRGALSMLSGIKLRGQERPKILVDLQLNDFPDRAEALNSFDLLVFNDTDTSKLTPGQKDALLGWVMQGGHLVIGGGVGALQTLAGLPDDLLPVRVRSNGEIMAANVSPLVLYAQTNEEILSPGPFVVALGDLGSESKLLAGSEEIPLVIEKELGSGIVHFVSLDLTAAPFNGWAGNQAFWETVIGPRGIYSENMPIDMSLRQMRSSSLFYPLSNIPSLDLPSVKGILILLGIYILFIGPVNYLILRKMRKLHLAWVTIPVITAVFAVGSFGIGYAMRGNDLVLNKIALVQLDPSGDAAVTSYMGLFSPREQAYEITVEGDALLSPMTGYEYDPWGTGNINTGGGEMVFLQGSPARLRGLTVNQWSMQSFMAEGKWNGFGTLEGDLILKDDTLVGTVRNASNYPLTDVVVIMLNRFYRLGDMAQGEEKDVNLGLSNLQNDRFGPMLSYRMFQEDQINGGPLSRESEQKMNIVSNVFENGPWASKFSSISVASSTGAFSGGIAIMGWLDQAPPEVYVEGNTLSYRTTAMVFQPVTYKLPDSGLLTIPTGLIPGAITKFPPGTGNCGTTTSINMGQGEAEFEYQIPDNLADLNITTLKVSLYRDSGVAGGLPKIDLYNWNKESWTQIQDPIQGTNIIQNAAAYVDQGKIKLRLSVENNNFSCIYVDMGLDALQTEKQGAAQ